MDPVAQAVYEKYPQMAWALNHPELGPLLRRAVEEGWDAARFQGELLKTAWYTSSSDTARTWERLLNEDPASARQLLSNNITTMSTLAARLGVSLNFNAWQSGWLLAVDATREGWDELRMQQELVRRARYQPDAKTSGAIGAAQDNVKALAAAYLVPMTDRSAWRLGIKTLTGEMDDAGLRAYFKDQAVARFGGNKSVVRMLNQGLTARDIFAPYVQQTASILEINPESINLLDRKWAKMLDYVDDKGVTRPMTLTEAGRFVRGLDDFKATDNAMEQSAGFAEFISQRMGAVA